MKFPGENNLQVNMPLKSRRWKIILVKHLEIVYKEDEKINMLTHTGSRKDYFKYLLNLSAQSQKFKTEYQRYNITKRSKKVFVFMT